jgi:hypothetical protein
MSTAPELAPVSWTPTPARTVLAAGLSMVPCVGGLGYLSLYKLGQARKALRFFALLTVLWAINGYAVMNFEADWPGMVLTPLCFVLQILSAADCTMLAGLARRRQPLPKNGVAVRALDFLGN